MLAAGLPMGVHKVEVSKMTEASVGTSQFMGFDFGAGTLLPPPPAKTRHIEFLGDSASNGYGIEGVAPCAFSAATQNARKGYPFLVTTALNADHHSLTTSGKGVYRNYYRPDTEVFDIIYQRTLPFVNGSAWTFTDYSADVVWITLGGNDHDPGFGGDSNPLAPGLFETKYTALVNLVRSKHANAHIFCTVAPSLNNVYPAGFNAYTSVKTALTNVVNAKNGAGDTKVYFFEFTRSVNADLDAREGHPNAAKNVSMAAEAVTMIKSKTGW